MTEVINIDKEHRIKVVHYADWDLYIPQWKAFIFWHDYKTFDYDSERYLAHTFDSVTDTIKDVVEFMQEEDERCDEYGN